MSVANTGQCIINDKNRQQSGQLVLHIKELLSYSCRDLHGSNPAAVCFVVNST
jgi:hypothetical protein